MTRSFSDRVFAGICGGLAKSTRINAWIWRVLFIVLTVASRGAFLAAYLILWWIVPVGSPAGRKRGVPLIIVLAILVLAGVLWYADVNGFLVSPTDIGLYIPILLFAVAVVYFLKQIRIGGARS